MCFCSPLLPPSQFAVILVRLLLLLLCQLCCRRCTDSFIFSAYIHLFTGIACVRHFRAHAAIAVTAIHVNMIIRFISAVPLHIIGRWSSEMVENNKYYRLNDNSMITVKTLLLHTRLINMIVRTARRVENGMSHRRINLFDVRHVQCTCDGHEKCAQ